MNPGTSSLHTPLRSGCMVSVCFCISRWIQSAVLFAICIMANMPWTGYLICCDFNSPRPSHLDMTTLPFHVLPLVHYNIVLFGGRFGKELRSYDIREDRDTQRDRPHIEFTVGSFGIPSLSIWLFLRHWGLCPGNPLYPDNTRIPKNKRLESD